MRHWIDVTQKVWPLAFILIFIACERTPFNPDYEHSLDGLGIKVWANQANIEYGDPIEITLEIVNLTDKKKYFELADSGTYDCVIRNIEDECVWRHSNVYGVLPMGWTLVLNAHQRKTYTAVCEDTLEVGQYSAEGWCIFQPTLRDTTGFVVLDGSH